MVSKLKQQMCRARAPMRTPAPDAARSGERVQYLELEGRLKLKFDDESPLKADKQPDDLRIFVGAWVGSAFAYGERGTDGGVSFRVPVDTLSDVDTLKLQLYCHVVDPETGLAKPFPLGESLACLKQLGACKEVSVEFVDMIMDRKPGVLKIASKTRVDTSRLRRSAMYDVKASNDIMSGLAMRVGAAIEAHGVHVPKVAAPFIEGLGYLPSGGNEALGVPAVMTHYGALSGLVDRVDRYLPHALLAYYLQMVLTQEGLTIDQANALPDRHFARLAGDVLWGTTFDAGAFPYQRDCTEAEDLCLSPTNGLVLQLQPVTTEDIGLPFAASNFILRDLAPHARPAASRALGLSRPAPPDPRAVYTECLAAIAAGTWQRRNVALGADDCETSSMAGKLAANTVRDKDMGAEAFRQGLELDVRSIGDNLPERASPSPQFQVFQAWTQQDVNKASAFFTRTQNMFRDGSLNISLVVGLAGGASASVQTASENGGKSIDEMQDLGGHCFAVLRHAPPAGPVYVRLLEGTSCVRVFHERSDGPVFTVCMNSVDASGKRGAVFKQELPLTKFLTLLNATVSEETRVATRVIGGGAGPDAAGMGVQAGKDLPGFLRPTIAMRCLHSLDASSREGSELGFYKWCMYTGLTGDAGDFGTLPLESGEYAKCLGAGCRPVSLASASLQGFGIGVPSEQFEVPVAVLNEVWPPIASPAQFRSVLNLWAPLESLCEVNARVCAHREAGVEYVSIACMETPASPDLLAYAFAIKSAQIALANEINRASPKSDGIAGRVVRIGTGVQTTLDVPLRALTLTYVGCLREAKARMGWKEPGSVPKKTSGEADGY